MKQSHFLIIIAFFVLHISIWGGSSQSQAPLTDLQKYGPGFPDYCGSSTYSNRPECLNYNNTPIPVEPDPCFQTGGYQQGCIPTQQYPCLPGDPSPNCLPSTPPTLGLPPAGLPPAGLPPGCKVVGAGKISCIGPIGVPPPTQLPRVNPIPPRLNVYNFRLDTPPPAPNCGYTYSPHCLAIAPTKLFESQYSNTPTIPTYYLYAGSQRDHLEYRVNSPYHGYLYVFVTEADQTTKLLYPNAYSDTMYVNPGRPVVLPGPNAGYTLEVTAPTGMHKLFFVVLSKAIPKEEFQYIRSETELNRSLLNLGLNENIYHGYAETAFNVQYVIY